MSEFDMAEMSQNRIDYGEQQFIKKICKFRASDVSEGIQGLNLAEISLWGRDLLGCSQNRESKGSYTQLS